MNAKPLPTAAEEARRLVNELIRIESRGAGDTESAMRRLAHRYGLSWRVFWNLKYRKQKDVFVGVLRRLREAHLAECRRQMERLRHEIEIAKINGVRVDDLEMQVDRMAGELDACVADHRED